MKFLVLLLISSIFLVTNGAVAGLPPNKTVTEKALGPPDNTTDYSTNEENDEKQNSDLDDSEKTLERIKSKSPQVFLVFDWIFEQLAGNAFTDSVKKAIEKIRKKYKKKGKKTIKRSNKKKQKYYKGRKK